MPPPDAAGRLGLAALARPDRTAVLVQELQEGVVGAGAPLPALADAARRVGVVEHAAALLAAARRAGVHVVHCTAESLPGGFGANRNARLFAGARRAGVDIGAGSRFARPVAQLGPEGDDVVVRRPYGLSPLSASPLDGLLRNEGVEAVVVVGVSLNVAVTHLVFDAVSRAYQVIVPVDAVAGTPVEYGEAVLANSLGLVATLTTTGELARVWGGAG